MIAERNGAGSARMKVSLYVGETRDLEGAAEAVPWPFPAGDDPASLAATLDAMQQLAAR